MRIAEGAIMDRYSHITNKNKREIVLLKGSPCKWGRCSFCDYIDDNSTDTVENHRVNEAVLNHVTGEYGVLEVINSGNIFELPQDTLDHIKKIIHDKNIDTLYFESHWIYRKKLQAMRDFFGIQTIVKTGLESFHREFREEELVKGFDFDEIHELKEYFDSICLMVGIKGQTKEMIDEDIRLAMDHFDHFTVNVYVNNTTSIQADSDLIKWFELEYHWLNDLHKCDVLWSNTDFGVGD